MSCFCNRALNNKVVYETSYSPQGVSSIDLRVDLTKNSDYIVNVKNSSNGKIARYGTVKIFCDELGDVHKKTNFSTDAFSKTLN